MVSISPDRRTRRARFDHFGAVRRTEELRAELADLRLRCAQLERERAGLVEARDALMADQKSASR